MDGGAFGMVRRNVTNYEPPQVSFPSGQRWYVVRSNIRCEARAQMGLDAGGFRTFLPQVTKWRSHARVKQIVRVPLFPRYFFVEADWNLQSLDTLHKTHGVESIVNNRGVPSTIYGEFVLDLIERQLKGEFDTTKDEPLPLTARVMIMEGKYAECPAIIARMPGQKRAELLISIMGKKVRDTLALANLRPAW